MTPTIWQCKPYYDRVSKYEPYYDAGYITMQAILLCEPHVVVRNITTHARLSLAPHGSFSYVIALELVVPCTFNVWRIKFDISILLPYPGCVLGFWHRGGETESIVYKGWARGDATPVLLLHPRRVCRAEWPVLLLQVRKVWGRGSGMYFRRMMSPWSKDYSRRKNYSRVWRDVQV